MSASDPFGRPLLPGMFGGFETPDEAALHIAGFDHPGVRLDPPDDFPNDPDFMDEDGPKQWKREHLPQFGPPFVGYVHDHFTALDAKMEKLIREWSQEPTTVVFLASMQTSGTGGLDRSAQGNALLYEPQPGWTLALHRLTINAIGFTFGAPFTGAGAYYEIRADNDAIDGGSLVAGSGSLPVARTWGTRDAPHIRDGEMLSLFMASGPANTQIIVRGQGTLERDPDA